MNDQEYEQQQRECWDEYNKCVVCGTGSAKYWFLKMFQRAYELGLAHSKVEGHVITSPHEEIELSFHVALVPCAEEYYMGVSASYEAYSVSVPTALIPPALLSIIQEKINNKRITGIAIMK